MKYAVMSLDNYRLIDCNEERPIRFETYDEAEQFIEEHKLFQVAIVPVDEEEICARENIHPR